MKREVVTVAGQPAKVWLGGAGEPLLLVHGAWGGAALHWEPVWDALARRFRVIAPELPGVGDPDASALASFDAYADWLVELLHTLGAERVWCVGNSLGAAIAWQLAARLGERCAGVVLVNGPPPAMLPGAVRALASSRPGRALFRALFRRLNFSPGVATRGFADPAHVPAELAHTLAAPPAARIETLIDLVLAGARAAAPARPTLLLWGAADRLPATGAGAAKKLGDTLDARLVLLSDAGHCPQLEQPAAFVAALERFAA
jgi:2-hydroxy-6-oxonona-2,4-dienedioate hydrolase